MVVVSSDSFKGSLTSLEVGDAVRLGLLDVAPAARVVVVPVADGGEGTVASALAAGWTAVPVAVHGPTGEPVSATLAVRPGGSGRTVVVEMADACGLGRLPDGIPAPLTASSRGLGEAISAALDLGADEVVVGVGGSASTDGGAGLLAALGARVLDAEGNPLPDGGAALAGLDRVDLPGSTHAWPAPPWCSRPTSTARCSGRPAPRPSSPRRGRVTGRGRGTQAALTHWSDAVAAALPVPEPTNRSQPGPRPAPGLPVESGSPSSRCSGPSGAPGSTSCSTSSGSTRPGRGRPARHRRGQPRRADPRRQGEHQVHCPLLRQLQLSISLLLQLLTCATSTAIDTA